MTAKIAVLEGDYIGPEIMSSGLAVLAAVSAKYSFDYQLFNYPFGGQAIDKTGQPLPEETLQGTKEADAVLLSAIGGPKWDKAEKRPEQGLLEIRKELSLFANIRPTRILPSQIIFSPLKAAIVQNTDFVIVRELTSGAYFGKPRSLDSEKAIDTIFYSKNEIERIMRQGYDLAMKRKKHVTIVDKSNVLATSKLWRRIAKRISVDYPAVKTDFCYVDAMSMALLAKPSQFDVIITANLFGDILSDEAAQISGSIGTIPSMSVGSQGPKLYEPIHGSAPDIAGQGIADPISMINSVAMMLEHSFDRKDMADEIQKAVDFVLAYGPLTPDLNGQAVTEQVTKAIAKKILERKIE